MHTVAWSSRPTSEISSNPRNRATAAPVPRVPRSALHEDLLHIFDDAPRAFAKELSRFGEFDAVRIPDKQLRADAPFEFQDLRGWGRLRDAQMGRGIGEVQMLGDSKETTQLTKIHTCFVSK
jgi:hypothetical protein